MKLEDKVAVVTGAGRGIGKAIALAFAREGADLVLAARTMTELEETASGVRALGRNALAVKCDVARRGDVTAMVGTALERFGRVDILVNNAGRITPLGPLVDSDPEEWLATISVNLGGVFRCCQAVLPIMLRQGVGKIINLSGGGATSASPYFSAYGASKTAVIRLTETLAEELKEDNIQVNAIAPGAVYTRMTGEILRAGRAAGEKPLDEASRVQETGGTDPGKAAVLAVFLASDESDGLTGRLLSAVWDDWQSMTPTRVQEIQRTDWYTLRRVVPTE